MRTVLDVFSEYADPNETIDVGNGWRNIVLGLVKKLVEIDPHIEVMQIKEKFGGLRFYIGTSTERVFDLIHIAEAESFKTCENCGTKDEVTTKPIGGKYSWIKTMCKKCRGAAEKNGL